MNQQQARDRVAETFPKPFNDGKFLEFTRGLLNKFDETKAQAWNSTYIKDAFKDHVNRHERLGTYTSPDGDRLDVLVVHLTAKSKLERARTAIRNFVADHLKTRDSKYAALVAFVSPTERQWRFSYVKMEYAAVEKEDGKVGVQTKLTPARRSSYIVGEGESCHTAQSRFLDLLQDTENHPTLAQIEDAFIRRTSIRRADCCWASPALDGRCIFKYRLPGRTRQRSSRFMNLTRMNGSKTGKEGSHV